MQVISRFDETGNIHNHEIRYLFFVDGHVFKVSEHIFVLSKVNTLLLFTLGITNICKIEMENHQSL